MDSRTRTTRHHRRGSHGQEKDVRLVGEGRTRTGLADRASRRSTSEGGGVVSGEGLCLRSPSSLRLNGKCGRWFANGKLPSGSTQGGSFVSSSPIARWW